MHKIIKKRISATKADTEKEKENTEKLQSYYLKRNKNNETILKISVMLRTKRTLLFLMLIFSFYLLLNGRRLINHQIVCLIILYILSLLFSNLLRFYGSKETQTKI